MFSKLGGGGKPEEEKTVTAGTSAIEVLPSSGKTMKKVTANPTPSQSKTVSPSTSQQTVSPDAGKLLSQVIVNAMASGALSNITVSSAGLITAQVGTSGYLASGTKKTKQITTQAAKTVTPSESEQTAVAGGRYTTGVVKVAAIPADYVKLLNVFGYTNVTYGDITLSTKDNGIEITHGLGVKPKFFVIFAESLTSPSTNDLAYLLINTEWEVHTGGSGYNYCGGYLRCSGGRSPYSAGDYLAVYDSTSQSTKNWLTDSVVHIYMSTIANFRAGAKYRWIAAS